MADVYRVFYVRLSIYVLTILKEKIIIIIIISIDGSALVHSCTTCFMMLLYLCVVMLSAAVSVRGQCTELVLLPADDTAALVFC